MTGLSVTPLALLATLVANLPVTIASEKVAAVQMDQFGHIARLNRQSFGGNVLDGTGGLSDHWIVFFCVPWWEMCVDMWETYHTSARHYDGALNAHRLLSNTVRFAFVDCATDKQLCNKQLIASYPTVVHYTGGVRVDELAGAGPVNVLSKQLSKFLKQELETPSGRPHLATANIRSSIRQDADAMINIAPMVAVFFVFVFQIASSVAELWSARRAAAARVAVAEARVAAAAAAHAAAAAEREPKREFLAEPTTTALDAVWVQKRSSIEL